MKRKDFGKIGVLAGGTSSEREISLKSGRAVYDALKKAGVDAYLIDIRDEAYDVKKYDPIDVAFIALHGRFGEDGSIQAILEHAGIPYTGSGPKASKLAIDKIAAKDIFIKNGIPVPRYIVFEKSSYDIKKALPLGFPVVVKPQREGSSIGLSIAKDIPGLEEAMKKAFEYGPRILLEEYIEGRELTVGVLDDEPLPVIEIVAKKGVYDYMAKYDDPETKYLVPAPVEKADFEKAKRLGKLSHRALGCRSFSRTDMMMDKRGNIFVLELNTIPGMTERSLLPKAAGATGLGFGELCIKLIENALKGAIS
jgi:D-alanine-D-alanine ligase